MISLLIIVVTFACVVFYLQRPTVFTKLYARETEETADGIEIVHNFYSRKKVWK